MTFPESLSVLGLQGNQQIQHRKTGNFGNRGDSSADIPAQDAAVHTESMEVTGDLGEAGS